MNELKREKQPFLNIMSYENGGLLIIVHSVSLFGVPENSEIKIEIIDLEIFSTKNVGVKIKHAIKTIKVTFSGQRVLRLSR